jgi:pSer/pThr/pTyr-binding forkhead associated (FHA) protein/uncharacterized RDD family membrane protein YckC
VAKLIVNPTSTNRREILLSRSMILTIGRDPSNDLVLADAMVSRRHAVVEHRGSQYFLRDCNSVNGSVVNGDRVGERVLRDGDLVAIGSMRLLFREELEEGGAGKVVQHPSAAPLECPSCHASYRRGDLYCRECGGQVAQPSGPPRAVCPSCATAVPLPARFCNACGAPLVADGQRLGEDEASSPSASRDTGPEVAPALASGSMAMAPQARSDHSPRTAPGTPAPAERRQLERRAPLPARAGAREGAQAAPAPPGTRLVAFLTDAVFVASAQAIMLAPVAWYWSYRPRPAAAEDVAFLPVLASVALVPLAALAGALYHVYFWAVRGATPGKEMFGLRVEDEAGRSPIGLPRAARRALGYLLCVASLGIGFAMVAAGGVGLHDRIAGTRVVRAARR